MLVAGAAACLVGARLLALSELYVLGATGLILVAMAVVWSRRRCDLDVRRELHPHLVSVGSPARMDLAVTHRGRRAPVVVLVDPVEGTVGARVAIGPLGAATSETVAYRLPTRRRGLVAVGPLHVEVADPFGLARRRRQVADAIEVTVLPAIDVGQRSPTGAGRDEPLAGAVARHAATSGAPDVATLRPYVVGDDLRRVHWPSTARLDDLVVRGAEDHHRRRATVVLDCRDGAMGPEAFEAAVSQAAGLVHAVATEGDLVRLVATTGLDSGMVDARRNELLLLQHLALVAQHPGPTSLPADLTAAPSARSPREVAPVVLTGGPDPLRGEATP